MNLPDAARASVFAIALVLLVDWGTWLTTRFWLSSDYEDADWWKARRRYETRWRLQTVRAALALAFILSFVCAMQAANENLAWVSLAALLMFFIASFYDSFRAFRHFAAANFTRRETGGYREP